MRYIVSYNNNLQQIKEVYRPDSYKIIGGRYIILEFDNNSSFEEIEDMFFPRCYATAMDDVLEATGVEELREITDLNLFGNGVVVGIIDDSIDVRSSTLINADGSSKIIAYLDQTSGEEIIKGNDTSYSAMDLSVRNSDINNNEMSHGTVMATIICGEPVDGREQGIAPNAEIVGVSLRRADDMLYDYYNIPKNVNAYCEADIMEAVDYVLKQAGNRPLVILLPFETNLGTHTGDGLLEDYLSIINSQLHTFVVVPAGNQATNRAHTSGQIFNVASNEREYKEISFYVKEQGNNTFMSMILSQGARPQLMIESPTGELREVRDEIDSLSFLFEGSKILVKSYEYDNRSEKAFVIFRCNNMAEGIWKIYLRVNNTGKNIEYNCYLPVYTFSRGNVEFTSPVFEKTITSPGDSRLSATVGAYNDLDDRIYPPSGNGGDNNKPEFCAPGVDVKVYNGRLERMVTYTGTSVSAAVTAGIGALILQWAVVLDNGPYITGTGVKQLLINGCIPKGSGMSVGQWGNGAINIFESFNVIRE